MKTNHFSRIEIMRAENGVIVAQVPNLSPSPAVPSHSSDHVFTNIEELFEFLEKKIVMPDMPDMPDMPEPPCGGRVLI